MFDIAQPCQGSIAQPQGREKAFLEWGLDEWKCLPLIWGQMLAVCSKSEDHSPSALLATSTS